MKPINIVLLVLAGAIGGAVVMRVTHRQAPRVVATARAPAPAPVPAPDQPPVTPPATTTAEAVQPVDVPPVPDAPVVATPPAPAKPAKPVVRPVPVQQKRPSPFRRPPEVAASVQHQDSAPPREEPVTPPVQVPPALPPPPPEPVAPARPEVRSAPSPAPPPPEPVLNTVTLNAGMLIPVRLLDALSSERNSRGDAFMATLDKELVADGFVIAERGARVEGQVVSVDRGSNVRGGAALAVELTRIRTSDDQIVTIQTDSFEKRSQPNRTHDIEKVAGGAAIGAIVGAIVGGGQGAAIGAGVGGGAGTAGVILTRQPATLPSETRIAFRLKNAVTLTERTR